MNTQHTPTPWAELERIVALDRRQAAICTRLGCMESAKDYSDEADRLTTEIAAMRRDARTRLTPLIRRHHRAARANAGAA